MRNDNYRTVFLDCIDTCLDLFGSNRIEAGSWFVQEDDRWILEEHTGNGNALLLTSRKLLGSRLEAVRQFHDLVVDIRFLGSIYYFLFCGIRTSIADIFFNTSIEDMVFLKYHTDVVT